VTNAQTNFTENEISEKVKSIKVNEQITLGYSVASGVKIIYKEGLPFKDLNKNGQVDLYEDWRQNVVDRAKDLASKMTIDQIAGLMLYS
jgi:beta-glucosidase